MSKSVHGPSSSMEMARALWLTILTVIFLVAQPHAWAQTEDRTGKEVVEATCATCHATGVDGAPKIGDAEDWISRASLGLTTLTMHALDGIREMPAHGGNPGITDFEIKRAITYMVNESGGSWAEPIGVDTQLDERSGESVVQAQCAKCHESGEGGAPRIGDLDDWMPRLAKGLNVLVRSAIHGHGGMPARGGMADFTDSEIQNAILYLFNPVSLPAEQQAVASTKHLESDPRIKVIGGVAIHLGVVPVESLGEAEVAAHGGAPRGKDYYHVNVSLLDDETEEPIEDAQVEVTVKDPVMGDATKKLDRLTINQAVSYGNYFKMTGWDRYSITVRVLRSDKYRPINADFDVSL